MAKAKTEFTELAVQVADQVKANRRMVLEQAEAVIRTAVEEGRELTWEDTDFLNSEAGYDRTKISQELRRVNRVVQLQMQAGTSADRDKLAEHIATTAAELKTRGPDLDAQIAALQAERAKIEKAATTAQRRGEEVEQALDGLAKSVSPSVAASYNFKKTTLKNTMGRDLSEMKIDANAIKGYLAGPEASGRNPEFYWQSLQSFDRELVAVKTDAGRQIHYAYSDKWPSVKVQLAAELPKQEQEIATLQARFDEELAALESELQTYWR